LRLKVARSWLAAVTIFLFLVAAVTYASRPASASTGTLTGPQFQVSPSSITTGGTDNIMLGTSSNLGLDTYPVCGGVNVVNPATNCAFNFCPGGSPYAMYEVHQVQVTAPGGVVYNLGSATQSGLADSFNDGVGVRTTGQGYAPSLIVSSQAFSDSDATVSTTSFSVPFGALGSLFSSGFTPTSSTPTSPGSYFWWLDSSSQLTSGASPTSASGTYRIDIEGDEGCTNDPTCSNPSTFPVVGSVCPEFFDIVISFSAGTTTTTSSTTTSTTTTTTTTGTGATRTIGFWKTHLSLEQQTWAAYIAANPGGATICGLTITTAAQAMGGLWANPAKTSTGSHRDSVAQAEMNLVHQWIGALLNAQAFGTSDGGLLASGAAACNTDDSSQITSAGNALDTFNGSGDNISSGIPEGSADPQGAQAFANVVFWDNV